MSFLQRPQVKILDFPNVVIVIGDVTVLDALPMVLMPTKGSALQIHRLSSDGLKDERSVSTRKIAFSHSRVVSSSSVVGKADRSNTPLSPPAKRDHVTHPARDVDIKTCGNSSRSPPVMPTAYEGNALPGQVLGRVARITFSNSLLSAGFWRKAVAPACNVLCSSEWGSRAVKTITGIFDRVSLFCRRSKTT